MADTILLNDRPLHFSDNDLPCLIHAAPKTGGSHFSITLIADLFVQGHKIVFFTAYPMAMKNFFEQIGPEMKQYTTEVTHEDMLDEHIRGIILQSGNETLLLKTLRHVHDIDDHIIFVKNIDSMSTTLLDSLMDRHNIILSGNIDACAATGKLIGRSYATTIFFSPSKTLPLAVSPSTKYVGYLKGRRMEGPVTIQTSARSNPASAA